MTPELASLILNASEVLAATIADHAHPGAAEYAVRRARDAISARRAWGGGQEQWYEVADAALGACEKATRVYSANPEHAVEVLLRAAQRRLESLVKVAEAGREEACV